VAVLRWGLGCEQVKTSLQMSCLCILLNYMSCVGVRTAADSNDITESSHDVTPTIGVLGFLIFIHVAHSCFSMQLLLQGVSIVCYAEPCISYDQGVHLSVCPSHAGT